VRRPVAVYTALRVVAFIGSYGLLLLVGLRGLLAILAALLLSSIASLYLLRRQRDAVTAALAVRAEQRAAEKARLRGMLADDGEPGGAGGTRP
jgi:hypothetical protein